MEVNIEGTLVLVFTKSTTPSYFNSRKHHIDVELVLIDSPPPILPKPGLDGVDVGFTRPALSIRTDRINGVTHETGNKRLHEISDKQNSILAIPLTPTDFKNVVEFLYAIIGIRYNHFDSFLMRTASLLFAGSIEDVVVDRTHPVNNSINCLHASQLVTILLRYCVTDGRRFSAKLWGFNSRLVSSNDVFERLRVTCVALDADRFACGSMRALSEGGSRKMIETRR